MHSPLSQKRSIALIGLGNQGREHLEAVRRTRLPLCLVSAIDAGGLPWDVVLPEGCQPGKSHEEIPAEVTAVIIATPPKSYAALVPPLLAAGKHILVEKPLGLNLSEALEFARLADQAERVLMPALQRRFHAAYQSWPHWRDRLGEILEAEITLKIKHEGEGWRAHLDTAGGGTLFDLGFHAIDLSQQLFGDLHLRSATFFDRENNPEHSGFDFKADLLLETEMFRPVRILTERAAPEKFEQLRVRGSEGMLSMTRSATVFTPTGGSPVTESYRADWTEAMEKQLESWLGAIDDLEQNRPEPLTPLPVWNGATAMRLMEEAYAKGRF